MPRAHSERNCRIDQAETLGLVSADLAVVFGGLVAGLPAEAFGDGGHDDAGVGDQVGSFLAPQGGTGWSEIREESDHD